MKSFLPVRKLRAFTLIELLVVIGVLTVLLAIVLIAINPARQFAQANNTQRRSDVNAILNAVHQYGADNKGDLSALGLPSGSPGDISSAVEDLCEIDQAGAGTSLLVSTYIADLPLDPETGTTDATGSETCDDLGALESYDTGYQIEELGNGRITVTAPDAQLGETIRVTR